MGKNVAKTEDEERISREILLRESRQASENYGINAHMEINHQFLNQKEIEKRKSERFDLQYISEALEKLILNSNVVLDHDILITDEVGYILFIITKGTSPVGPVNIGVSLADNYVGTNAFCLTLKYLIPFNVAGQEHYLSALQNYRSVSIPIIRDGYLLGTAGYISSFNRNKKQPDITEFIIKTAVTGAIQTLKTQKLIDEIQLMKEILKTSDNPYGYIITDLGFKIIQANRETEIILGVGRHELLEKHISTFVDLGIINEKWKDIWENSVIISLNIKDGNELKTKINPVIDKKSRQLGWIFEFIPNKKYNEEKNKASNPPKFEFKDIIGINREFLSLLRIAEAVAPTSSNVLITGESGTGKELFVQAIHYSSGHKEGPFIAINCAAVPRELMESELFGYVGGAFTGARKSGTQGKIIQANGGTLFLDEIGDMPLEMQSKLLRVLQDKIVVPVGGSKQIILDFRLICATNANLEEMMSKKCFRRDLYYRINVAYLKIPPLRERKDDIPLLAEYLMKNYSFNVNKNIIKISPEAMGCLLSYNWPGNIRELKNVLEMAINIADKDTIEIAHLPSHIKGDAHRETKQTGINFLEEVEIEEIKKALKFYNGNIARVAVALGIGRTTVYRKIRQFGLTEYMD